MSNVNMEGLPPEMQQRIASIIEGAKQKVIAESPHQAAIAPQTNGSSVSASTKPDGSHHRTASRSSCASARASCNRTSYRGCGTSSGLTVFNVSRSRPTPSTYGANFQAQVPQPQVDEDY